LAYFVSQEFLQMIIPPHLKKGDIIGIAATARKISQEEINDAIVALKAAGYETLLAKNIFAVADQFAGTDQMRADGVNELLQNESVKAIWCARGGYGSVRLIDKIDWAAFLKNPKWLCGFSDVTALHNHLQQELGIASIHSEMMLGFNKNKAAAHESLLNALAGLANTYVFKGNSLNVKGKAIGEIVGGNLSVIYSMLGSKSQLNTAGKILFLEDLDEYLYHIDRMMMALKRAGMLANLKALVVGGMSDMRDNAIPFGKTAEEIILNVAAEYDFPICFDFPAGHLPDNRALVFGATAEIEIDEKVTFSQKL